MTTAIKKTILPILLTTIWISLSEFIRNEFLLKSYWTDHYRSLGLLFPAEPLNGAVWGLWSFFLSLAIYFLCKKYSLLQSALLSWFMAFVMMWVVIGNLGVLPANIMMIAVPLSLLEIFVAAFILKKLS